jgi:very-short-patch-repair endonuclease
MRDERSPPDQVIAKVARRQHGVVACAQLADAGIDRDAAIRRVRSGRLHRVHHGVYAVGHPSLSAEGRWMAAVLSVNGAVLSHRSAAALWRLLPNSSEVVDVLIPHEARCRRRRGIRIHRSRTLTPELTSRRHGIPVTTPARTIADLRRVVPPERLRRAIREAEVLGFDLGPWAEPQLTRSELEHLFLRLCRRHRLPVPEANAPLGRFVVDFLWRNRSVIAETDGYRFHRGRQAFEDDRARVAELQMMGFEVVRFTYRQVLDEPKRVAATLRALLARAGDEAAA